ncbi:hypothetical protein FLA_4585 [Filimonas lacunae]|nr:hypothetical protein FLA_4585 [Filimonas lacunae]
MVGAEASVKVIHTIPGTGAVDFYLNSTKQNSAAINFGEATGYIATSNGEKTAEFKTALDNNTVLSVPIDFDGGNYSLFATGIASDNSLTTLLVEDDLQTPTSGKARVRFVHVSPDAPTVNVLGNDSLWVSSRAYKTATDFIEVPGGSYTIKLNNSGDGTNAYTSSVINLASGKNYTLVAQGLVGNTIINPFGLNVLEY